MDTSTGALGNPLGDSQVNSVPTDQVPLGVAVDPCNRFVYVSDSLTNKVSAYTICSMVIIGTCPVADGSLLPITGSPFALSGSANGPGPLVVDPFGNNVYVIGTLSNTLSAFKISPISGALTALTVPTVATGLRPTSIAIRGDDNWMFVTNFNSATVSQYSITPATGALTAEVSDWNRQSALGCRGQVGEGSGQVLGVRFLRAVLVLGWNFQNQISADQHEDQVRRPGRH